MFAWPRDRRDQHRTASVGIFRYCLTFRGIQNHAGTMSKPIRTDARIAMMRVHDEVMAKAPAASGSIGEKRIPAPWGA